MIEGGLSEVRRLLEEIRYLTLDQISTKLTHFDDFSQTNVIVNMFSHHVKLHR